jgi:hypothetical protein
LLFGDVDGACLPLIGRVLKAGIPTVFTNLAVDVMLFFDLTKSTLSFSIAGIEIEPTKRHQA